MEELLVVRLGELRVALPTAQIERVEPMVAVTPLGVAAPAGVVGAVAYRGAMLAVVDPRPWFGLPTPEPTLDQRLVVVVTDARRFLLWIDAVDELVHAAPVSVDSSLAVVAGVATWGGTTAPVVSLMAFDPGALFLPEAP